VPSLRTLRRIGTGTVGDELVAWSEELVTVAATAEVVSFSF